MRVHAPVETALAALGAFGAFGAGAPGTRGGVRAVGPDSCEVELGGRDADEVAFRLGALDVEVTVVGPDELVRAVRRLADRYARAAG